MPKKFEKGSNKIIIDVEVVCVEPIHCEKDIPCI